MSLQWSEVNKLKKEKKNIQLNPLDLKTCKKKKKKDEKKKKTAAGGKTQAQAPEVGNPWKLPLTTCNVETL